MKQEKDFLHLVGKKYGGKTLIKPVICNGLKRRRILFECVCDCGFKSTVRLDYLQDKKSIKCVNCDFNINLLGFNTSSEMIVFNEMLSHYKGGAKARNIEFLLNKSDFKKIIEGDCNYCGSPPKLKFSRNAKHSYRVNGIDRVDSSKNYSIENCVPCCSMCNLMKLDSTLEIFKNQIKLIYKHLHEDGN